MKLSISTSWDFISGMNTKEESRLLLENFGSLESYLQFLKDLGVSSIELRYFDTGLKETDVINICRNLENQNFSLTIHSEIFEHNLDLDFNSTFPWLQAITRVYHNEPLLIVVHPIEGETKTQEEYRNLTIRKIKNSINAIQRANLNVKLALEIMQYEETLTSPGFTYEDVLDILTEINSDHLGICFDFGHTWSNIRRGFLAKTLPDAFLDRVIHAHIHDLGPDYKTHWPLTLGNVPVEEYVKLLAARRFNGVLNIELVYERFKTSISPKQAIEASLKKLGNTVKNI